MHTINLQLPTSWQTLTDKQLRFVFSLLAADHTSAQVKTLFLLRFGTSVSSLTKELSVSAREEKRVSRSLLYKSQRCCHISTGSMGFRLILSDIINKV